MCSFKQKNVPKPFLAKTAYDALPDPIIGRRGEALPISIPFYNFGASIGGPINARAQDPKGY